MRTKSMPDQSNLNTIRKRNEEAASPRVDSIPCDGLSPLDAEAVRELAAELLPFSPIPAPRLSRKATDAATKAE